MSRRIPEILGAYPFPILNPRIIPIRSRLLEDLFEDGNDVRTEEEVWQMYHKKQFAIDQDIVENKNNTNSICCTDERDNILNDFNGLLGLTMLVLANEVDATDEKRVIDENIENKNYWKR